MTSFIFQLLASILGWYLKKNAKDEASKKDYIAFTEIMNRKGLASVKLRLEAENQRDRIKDLWNDENTKKDI